MQVSTKLSLAAIAAAVITAPVSIALAADPGETTAGARPQALAAPLAGHRSVDGQMHRAARELHRRAHRKAVGGFQIPPILKRIAECESHGNPRSIGGGGQFRGLLQFTEETWHSVGGKGDPVDASAEEQYRRGAILLARSGPAQWPVCSQ
jgi:transglycosylase-like protein